MIAEGAEARIYEEEGMIIKDRVIKNYRLKEIDDKLRKSRTNRESKILEKLSKINFPSPKLIKKEDFKIIMEKIEGHKLRDVLKIEHCSEIGKLIKKIHNLGIIHGDLTTSNMILGNKIYLIDFGLSFYSDKIEDKAVDLHLLEEALISKHHLICKECINLILKNYNDEKVKKRLEIVKKRGKNKTK